MLSRLLSRLRRRVGATEPAEKTDRVSMVSLAHKERVDGGAFMLSPESGRSFIVTDAPPGPIRVWIRHSDAFLRGRPRSLFARVSGEGVTIRHDDREGNRLFLGGGFEQRGFFNRFIDIETAPGTGRFTVTFRCKAERFVNIDGFSVLTGSAIDEVREPDGTVLEADGSSRKLRISAESGALMDLRSLDPSTLGEARNLLLAEIDLNIIDGSSIWLSSMATILAARGSTLLLSRKALTTDVVTANIRGGGMITIVEPQHVIPGRENLSREEMAALARTIDDAAPRLDNIVVRGLDLAALLLEDRRFYKRADVYLTDFYFHAGDWLLVGEDRRRKAGLVARQARRLLTQTERIAEKLREVTGAEFESAPLPPPAPVLADLDVAPRSVAAPLRIGYSGKIEASWGLIQLFDWVDALRREGREIELTIIGDKLGGFGDGAQRVALRSEFQRRLEESRATHHKELSRADTLAVMAQMDLSWCWRPAHFEEKTLELSSKLVEGVINGFPCIAYPSELNRAALGEDYPYFVRSLEEFRALLDRGLAAVPKAMVEALRRRHDIEAISQKYRAALPLPLRLRGETSRICFSGHDFKFIDPYISDLRRRGVAVTRDIWEWGKPVDLDRSAARRDGADIVFAEWGLANAVWQSKTLPAGTRLFVRIHAQEVRPLAARFSREMIEARVDRFIFVSDRVRKEALDAYHWPAEKTALIPNFVLDRDFAPAPLRYDDVIRLGMVGIIPESKRLDRAIDLLEALLALGHKAELHIKGHRPESLEFMHAPARRHELDYYKAQYKRLETDSELGKSVIFHPWGNDVANFYAKIDHILSCSDHESFHYALADGVLTHRHPVLWSWEGAADVYSEDWVISSTQEAVARILDFRRRSSECQFEELESFRSLVKKRYGHATIFQMFDDLLGFAA